MCNNVPDYRSILDFEHQRGLTLDQRQDVMDTALTIATESGILRGSDEPARIVMKIYDQLYAHLLGPQPAADNQPRRCSLHTDHCEDASITSADQRILNTLFDYCAKQDFTKVFRVPVRDGNKK